MEVRDWNKDVELCGEGVSPIEFIYESRQALPYWLKQYKELEQTLIQTTASLVNAEAEAEKWRIEAFKKYPTPEAYDATCAALQKHRERADKAEQEVERLKQTVTMRYIQHKRIEHEEETTLLLDHIAEVEGREQKLKEAARKAIEIYDSEDTDEEAINAVNDLFTELLSSLYPLDKEEEAK